MYIARNIALTLLSITCGMASFWVQANSVGTDSPKQEFALPSPEQMLLEIQKIDPSNSVWSGPLQAPEFDTDEFFRSTTPEHHITQQIQQIQQERAENNRWNMMETIKVNNFMRKQKSALRERLQQIKASKVPLDIDEEIIIIDEQYRPTTQSEDQTKASEKENSDSNKNVDNTQKTVPDTSNNIHTRDPGVIKKFGWFKWYQQSLIIDALSDESLKASLDTNIQELEIKELTDKFAALDQEFGLISKQKELVDEKYRQLMVASTMTQKAIQETQKNINKRIASIKELNKQLKQWHIRLNTIAPDLDQASQDVITYTQSYYKLHNDIFATQSNEASILDDLKLFAKADNVAETLASDAMLQDLTNTLDTLVSKLWVLKATYAASYARYTADKQTLQDEVQQYYQEKKTLSQQIENFEEFLVYVRSNKAYVDSKQKELEGAKSELEEEVEYISLISQAQTKEDLDSIREQFAKDHKENEETFFQFPIDEIKKITSFFEDEGYAAHFHMSHYALDFRLAQWSFVYAPAPGYVYKVVNQNSALLNRFIILHSNNLATVYLHMQDTYVRPGMYVQQWEILWLSWGTPGTRGAGLMTTGPHLHREVWKDGELVDPMLYTDLSAVPRVDMVQRRHVEKWERDNGK